VKIILVEPEQHKQLKMLAVEEDTTIKEVTKKIIESYLENRN
jgi:hypothetical protein